MKDEGTSQDATELDLETALALLEDGEMISAIRSDVRAGNAESALE